MTAEVILTTIHGSHLYGLAREGSDIDLFHVVKGSGTAKHKVTDQYDVTTVPFDTFMANVFSGSHQSCEALFSKKAWVHPDYQPLFSGLRVTGADAFAKYRRTIHSFSYGDDKKRRHAVRLGFSLKGLRESGRFDPELTPNQRTKVIVLSQLYRGQSLYDIAINL